MDPTHATRAKELDRKTIEAAIQPVFTTEFTTVAGEYPPAFESHKFVEVKVAVTHPQEEWIVLAIVSFYV
jgi:hypothetical protein